MEAATGIEVESVVADGAASVSRVAESSEACAVLEALSPGLAAHSGIRREYKASLTAPPSADKTRQVTLCRPLGHFSDLTPRTCTSCGSVATLRTSALPSARSERDLAQLRNDLLAEYEADCFWRPGDMTVRRRHRAQQCRVQKRRNRRRTQRRAT